MLRLFHLRSWEGGTTETKNKRMCCARYCKYWHCMILVHFDNVWSGQLILTYRHYLLVSFNWTKILGQSLPNFRILIHFQMFVIVQRDFRSCLFGHWTWPPKFLCKLTFSHSTLWKEFFVLQYACVFCCVLYKSLEVPIQTEILRSDYCNPCRCSTWLSVIPRQYSTVLTESKLTPREGQNSISL